MGLPNDPTSKGSSADKAGRTYGWPTGRFPDGVDRLLQGHGTTSSHGTSSKTHCDFDYSGTMIEQMLLGLVAHRAGKRLEYDPKSGKVTRHGGA